MRDHGRQEPSTGQRWARLAVLLLLLLLLPFWIARRGRQAPIPEAARRESPPPAPAGAEPRLFGEAGPGKGTVSANPDRPAAIPLDVAPLPTPPPPPASVQEAPPVPPPSQLATTSVPPPPDSASVGQAGSDATTSEVALALAPRWLVHPNPQSKIVARRKIDGDVVLKTLVGADGRVQQVVVLHGIPNCDECTQSAVEAAQRYVYDPPVLQGGAGAVWTQPVEIHFGRRR